MTPSTYLAERLAEAGLPVHGTDDGPPLRYTLQPGATPEQIAAADAICDAVPAQLATLNARASAYTAAASAGCPVTIGDRTIVFAATVPDFAALMADLGAMVDLDEDGESDAPEYLMDKDSVMHELPTRSEARAFLRAYRQQIKAQWAAQWTQQEALRAAQAAQS
jgi:hypothetical protein